MGERESREVVASVLWEWAMRREVILKVRGARGKATNPAFLGILGENSRGQLPIEWMRWPQSRTHLAMITHSRFQVGNWSLTKSFGLVRIPCKAIGSELLAQQISRSIKSVIKEVASHCTSLHRRLQTLAALSGSSVCFSDYFLSVSQESFPSIWCSLFQARCCYPCLLDPQFPLFDTPPLKEHIGGRLPEYPVFYSSFLSWLFRFFLYILAALFHVFTLLSMAAKTCSCFLLNIVKICPL